VLFLGEYEHVIDAKQRLAIPAEVRDVFNPEQHGSAFIAVPGGDGSLWLWPERTFHSVARELQGSMLGDKDLGAYERRIFSQSARIPMDSAGRVRIPERLLKDHGLSGKAMVLGVGDHLEVFSPEQWSQDREKLEPVRSDIWNRARQNVALNQRNGNES
jgi:MraZ protein